MIFFVNKSYLKYHSKILLLTNVRDDKQVHHKEMKSFIVLFILSLMCIILMEILMIMLVILFLVVELRMHLSCIEILSKLFIGVGLLTFLLFLLGNIVCIDWKRFSIFNDSLSKCSPAASATSYSFFPSFPCLR